MELLGHTDEDVRAYVLKHIAESRNSWEEMRTPDEETKPARGNLTDQELMDKNSLSHWFSTSTPSNVGGLS